MPVNKAEECVFFDPEIGECQWFINQRRPIITVPSGAIKVEKNGDVYTGQCGLVSNGKDWVVNGCRAGHR